MPPGDVAVPHHIERRDGMAAQDIAAQHRHHRYLLRRPGRPAQGAVGAAPVTVIFKLDADGSIVEMRASTPVTLSRMLGATRFIHQL